MIGVSPPRPGRLYMVPPVDVQAATRPLPSTATAPMVPMFLRTLSAPCFCASWCSSCQRARWRGVISAEFGTSGMPSSRANASAPVAHISTWGLSSHTRRATRMGFSTVLTQATAPARRAVPSMQRGTALEQYAEARFRRAARALEVVGGIGADRRSGPPVHDDSRAAPLVEEPIELHTRQIAGVGHGGADIAQAPSLDSANPVMKPRPDRGEK